MIVIVAWEGRECVAAHVANIVSLLQLDCVKKQESKDDGWKTLTLWWNAENSQGVSWPIIPIAVDFGSATLTACLDKEWEGELFCNMLREVEGSKIDDSASELTSLTLLYIVHYPPIHPSSHVIFPIFEARVMGQEGWPRLESG